jgi:hypothetical protein
MPRRIRFRPPGVKPWTRIGPLGPFRGRLGLGWVIAPLVVGAVLAFSGWYFLLRSNPPSGSFVPVGAAASFAEGTARPVGVPSVFVGRTGGRLFAVMRRDGCTLSFCRGKYVDCRGVEYGIGGDASDLAGALDLLPLKVYRGTVYVDPDHPADRSPAPAPLSPVPPC